MSERDDADGAPVRRRWVRWAWPAATFVLISGFMFAAMFVRGVSPAAPAEPAVADPGPAQHVNTRAWRTIAADPAGHADERVVLWGQVTAYDPAADPTTFHANVDAARHRPRGGTVNYPTAVVLHGDPAALSKLSLGYIFTAEVSVDGAAPPGTVRPGTAAPGTSVMPRLTVTDLTVTDKTVGWPVAELGRSALPG